MESIKPFVLPTITFIGGETQDLSFSVYYGGTKAAATAKRPYSLAGCRAVFSVSNYTNRDGDPIITKEMRSTLNTDGSCDNVLVVTLVAEDTVDLVGKYIYQISMRDIGGDAELPNQGILQIYNNNNKGFIHQSNV